jgi:hypothetical protein
VSSQQGAFGSGEIVLGQFGDLLEEIRTLLVIEEPWRERSGLGGKSAKGFVKNRVQVNIREHILRGLAARDQNHHPQQKPC